MLISCVDKSELTVNMWFWMDCHVENKYGTKEYQLIKKIVQLFFLKEWNFLITDLRNLWNDIYFY